LRSKLDQSTESREDRKKEASRLFTFFDTNKVDARLIYLCSGQARYETNRVVVIGDYDLTSAR